MRIEQLNLQAFGSYVKSQQIDFAHLANHHLFLMRGPTGAGKTAILDAITYALYGKSSGGERGDFERMRCRLATPKEKTYVELLFVLKGHRYRFYREIAIGKKRNGEELWKVSVNGGEIIEGIFYPFFENCKQTLLEKKAEELIGLTHEQFIQVMILPQGKFEKLLISKSEEKQVILETLFQTQRWSKICDNLSEKLKQQKNKLDQLQANMDLLLASSEVTSFVELEEMSKDKEQAYHELLQRYHGDKEQMEEALHNYEAQVQLHQWKQRYDVVQKRKEALAQQVDQIRKKKERLQEFEAYQQLLPYKQAYDDASQKQLSLISRLKDCEQAYITAQTLYQNLQAKQTDMDLLAKVLQQYHKRLHRLEEQRGMWQEQSTLAKTYEELQLQVNKIKQTQTDSKETYERLKQQEQSLFQQLDVLEEQMRRLPQLVEQVQQMKERKQHFITLERLQSNIQEWQMKQGQQHVLHQQILEQETLCKAEHEQLYQSYLDNSAALLAELLEEGTPCPVCGSTHHPQIAILKQHAVDGNVLKQKKNALDHLVKKRQAIEAWLEQADKRIEEFNKQMKEIEGILEQEGTSSWDERAYLCLQEQRVACQRAQADYQTLKQTQKEVQEQMAQMEQQCVMQEEQLRHWNNECLICETQLKERKAKLQEHACVEEFEMEVCNLQAEIKQKEAMIQRWKQQLQEQEVSTSSYQTTLDHLKEELHQHTIHLEKTKQMLEKQNVQHLPLKEDHFIQFSVQADKQYIERYEQEWNQVMATLQEIQTQLQDQPLHDLKQVEIQKQQLELRYQTSLKEKLELEHTLKQLKQVQNSLQSLRGAYEETLLTYSRQSEFVKAMRGDTSIGIERYVLGIMLSSITQNANQLLKQVHGGRYQIYRSDEASGKTRKFGLELSIYDTYSCSLRSVVSLSGGEKFLVSLALSMALSTVVQARSGGVVMETMFIDEGFGSLDEQSIGDALQILSSMANSKAMIGIISHVELLKENIPYGIEVEKQRIGSTCHMLI